MSAYHYQFGATANPEPNAVKVYLATRRIQNSDAAKLYAYSITNAPNHDELRAAITFNLPWGESYGDSQQRALSWALGSLDRGLPIRVFTDLFIPPMPGYTNLKAFYTSAIENSAAEGLEKYIREVHTY